MCTERVCLLSLCRFSFIVMMMSLHLGSGPLSLTCCVCLMAMVYKVVSTIFSILTICVGLVCGCSTEAAFLFASLLCNEIGSGGQLSCAWKRSRRLGDCQAREMSVEEDDDFRVSVGGAEGVLFAFTSRRLDTISRHGHCTVVAHARFEMTETTDALDAQ